MDYKEILIECDNSLFDLLMTELGEFGFDSFLEETNLLKCYIKEDQFDQSKFKLLLTNSLFKKYNLSPIINHIKTENWNAQWESSFQPITIDDDLLIRAPFHESNSSFKMEVIIEPKMSFGTGHHDTTWMMSKVLFEYSGLVKDSSLLDMGCGTSILAIIASKLGAATIYAVDIDEWAVENSIENCERNLCNNITVEKGGAELLKNKTFEMILANINRNILMKDMIYYNNSLTIGGYILISGFFIVDETILINKAKELGLNLEKEFNKNGWACLAFKKSI